MSTGKELQSDDVFAGPSNTEQFNIRIAFEKLAADHPYIRAGRTSSDEFQVAQVSSEPLPIPQRLLKPPESTQPPANTSEATGVASWIQRLYSPTSVAPRKITDEELTNSIERGQANYFSGGFPVISKDLEDPNIRTAMYAAEAAGIAEAAAPLLGPVIVDAAGSITAAEAGNAIAAGATRAWQVVRGFQTIRRAVRAVEGPDQTAEPAYQGTPQPGDATEVAQPAAAEPDAAELGRFGFGRRLPQPIREPHPMDDAIQDSAGRWIHPTAEIGEHVKMGPGVEIWPGVRIENHATIYARARIGPGTSIGRGANVGENAWLKGDVKIGDWTSIHHDVSIGEGTEIGANSMVDSHTEIGVNGKIANNVNLFSTYRAPRIGDNVQIGPNTSMADLHIEDNVQIGLVKPGSSILEPQKFWLPFPELDNYVVPSGTVIPRPPVVP